MCVGGGYCYSYRAPSVYSQSPQSGSQSSVTSSRVLVPSEVQGHQAGILYIDILVDRTLVNINIYIFLKVILKS